MYPINQVILGNPDPMSSLNDIDAQMQMMDNYRAKLQQLKAAQNQQAPKLIWNDIDAEINSLSDEQKQRLFQNEEYVNIYTQIQSIVQTELLNLVKSKIESTQEGKELLQKQLNTLRKLKVKIVEDTNREMELFKRFKEYSSRNPGVTYEEFLKSNV
jgi:hypothetical protein